MWKNFWSSSLRKASVAQFWPTRVCAHSLPLLASERASITHTRARVCQTQRPAFCAERGDFTLQNAGRRPINRVRETTKRAVVVLPVVNYWIRRLRTAAGDPHASSYCCCWKNRRGPDPALFLFSTLYFSLGGGGVEGEGEGMALSTPGTLSLSFSLFILFLFFFAHDAKSTTW